MKIAVSELGELGELDQVSKAILREVMPTYRREAAKYAPTLAKLTRKYVREGMNSAIKISWLQAKEVASGESTPDPPSWVDDLIDPLLGPSKDAAIDEAGKVLKPAAYAIIAVSAAAVLAAFVLGRVTKKCVAR